MVQLDHTPEGDAREQRLQNDLIAWLATVRPDDRPHLVPVWFLWTGDEVIVTAESGSQKVRNMRGKPAVALSLDDTRGGAEPILIEGVAQIGLLEDDEAIARRYFDKYRQAMAAMEWPEAEARKTHSALIRIRVRRFVEF